MKCVRLRLKFLALGISSLVLASCGTKGPRVSICVFSGAAPYTFFCADPDGKTFDLPPEQARKYIAMSPSDSQAVKQYILKLESDLANCQSK